MPGPFVADRDLRCVACAGDTNLDPSGAIDGLGSVSQQVPEDLRQLRWVELKP